MIQCYSTFFRIPAENYFNVFRTICIMSIFSIVISLIIDYSMLNGKETFDKSDDFFLFYIIGLILYQFYWYLINLFISNHIHLCMYPFWSGIEFVQGYIVTILFSPIYSKKEYMLAKQESFQYTAVAYEYSIRIFVALSMASAVVFAFTKVRFEEDSHRTGTYFGIPYKKLEETLSLLIISNYVTFPLTFISELKYNLDFYPSINNVPMFPHGWISLYAILIFHINYSQRLIWLDSTLKDVTRIYFYAELPQLLLVLLYYYGPWTSFYPEAQETFKNIHPWVAIVHPITVYSTMALMMFNIILYYKISFLSSTEHVSPRRKPIYRVLDGKSESSTKNEIHIHERDWRQ